MSVKKIVGLIFLLLLGVLALTAYQHNETAKAEEAKQTAAAAQAAALKAEQEQMRKDSQALYKALGKL